MQSSPPNKPGSSEPEKVTLGFPDSADWDWPDEDQKEWRKFTKKTEEYVAFYDLWYDPTTRPKFRKDFPYPLSVGKGPTISPAGKPILITEAYDKMFHRLLDLRKKNLEGRKVKGAVITGQPGIGAPLTRSPVRQFIGFILQEKPPSKSSCSHS